MGIKKKTIAKSRCSSDCVICNYIKALDQALQVIADEHTEIRPIKKGKGRR